MDVDHVKVYFPMAREEECNQRGNARFDQCFVVLILFLDHIAAQSRQRFSGRTEWFDIEEEASLQRELAWWAELKARRIRFEDEPRKH